MSTREGRLRQFFAGYFNQDWDLGGDSWSQVVDNYVGGSAASDVRFLLDDLRAWLADSEGGLPAEFGCDYDPLSDGMDERAWVQALADYIGTRLGE
ncbi:MAG: hypothetical protein IPJ34_40245 [Myxococcales bacterium]|nr:hypothetical protein [Myxococcales bacterium]